MDLKKAVALGVLALALVTVAMPAGAWFGPAGCGFGGLAVPPIPPIPPLAYGCGLAPGMAGFSLGMAGLYLGMAGFCLGLAGCGFGW